MLKLYPAHHTLPDLTPFMYLTADVAEPIIAPISAPIIIRQVSDRLIVNQEDSLFWAIYIAKHGYTQYQSIVKYKNTEIQEKQNMINYYKINAYKLKALKITGVATQEIMSNLMLNKTTCLQSVIAICVFYELSLFLVKDNVYLYFDTGGEDAIVHVGKKYEVDIDVTPAKIDKIKELFRLENINKPLKPISHYKIGELEQIYKTVIGELGKKYKKAELYAELCNKIEM